MLQTSLTDIAIRKLSATENKRIEIWDIKVPGFGIRISPSGTKSFILLYRFKGRARRMTLGRYPTLSLAEGRLLARQALNQVTHGSDPQQDKQAANSCHRFKEAVETFLRIHCERHNRLSTRKGTSRILRKRFVVVWPNRDIREITRSDVLAILDSIVEEGSPSAANHALSAIRKFFNWCIERGLMENSPCAAIKRPAKLRSRDHVLSDDEIKRVWLAAEKTGYLFGPMVQLLLLTGQRRNEVASMSWEDINFERNYWLIPAELTKTNKQHVVPLSTLSQKVIENIPGLREGFIFPARDNEERTFSGFSKSKKRLDKLAGVSDWWLHDLRRTLATNLPRLGIEPYIVECILNHISGTFAGVAGVYNRFGYFDQKCEGLESWSSFIENLVSEPTLRGCD